VDLPVPFSPAMMVIETQLKIIVQERQTERIGRAVVDARWIEPDPPEIRRRQIGRSISSCHAPEPKKSTQRRPNRA
jgi:hypothetical protein